MPTLHDVTDKTKVVLKWGGISFIVLMTIIILFQLGIAAKNHFYPKPPTPPTVRFGKLPPIKFPKSKSKMQHEYTIDTITGRLPVFIDEKKVRDRIKVYKIQNSDLTLLDLQNTANQVHVTGFLGAGQQLQHTLYRFYKKDPLQKTMDIDIVNKNFIITSPFLTNATVLDAKNLPDESVAMETANNFLKKMNSLFPDIDTAKTKSQLLTIQNGKVVAVKKLSSAKLIRVNYYQNDIDTLPIFYVDAPDSSLHFFIASSETFDPAIVASKFFHQQITKDSATYPLKPIAVAFEQLKKGDAYISADYITDKTVNIKDILLGYYASDQRQDYLLPIYIFKGGLNDEFYAFVSAVPEKWTISQ